MPKQQIYKLNWLDQQILLIEESKQIILFVHGTAIRTISQRSCKSTIHLLLLTSLQTCKRCNFLRLPASQQETDKNIYCICWQINFHDTEQHNPVVINSKLSNHLQSVEVLLISHFLIQFMEQHFYVLICRIS